MSQAKTIADYDKNMVNPTFAAYYGYSDFFNLGYWTPETKTQKEASELLVEKLLEKIPDKSGSILDVACGLGASTRQLLRYYDASDVTAINVSDKQLARGRMNAPGVTFLNMDAVNLRFPDASFDNVLCVEAAFHFNTRAKFYREAFRVLKPGGRLVTSDILGPRWAWKHSTEKTPDDLRRSLAEAGFDDVLVEERTHECRDGFRANIKRWPGQERAAGRMSLPKYLSLLVYSRVWAVIGTWITPYYLLTSAQKPAMP